MDITERKKAEVQINRLNLEMEKRVVDRSREIIHLLGSGFPGQPSGKSEIKSTYLPWNASWRLAASRLCAFMSIRTGNT